MASTPSLKTRHLKLILTAWALLLIVILVLGELLARAFYALQPTAPPPYNTALPDGHYGWRCKPNYHFEGEMTDAAGLAYPVRYTTDSRGFRVYGQAAPVADAPVVWFIGDSYTQAVEVSDEATFYARAAAQFPMHLYASGMSGWGNLQEYLWLDQHLDSIQPDIIIWQVCANDCIDNYEPLAREAVYEVDERRPYLRPDGTVYYSQDTVSLTRRLARFSSLFKALNAATGRIVQRLGLSRGAEYQMSRLGRAYLPYDSAQHVTKAIFQHIQARIGPAVRLYLLDATDLPPTHADWQMLGRELGIPVIEAVPQGLRAAQARGITVLARDGWHWNPAGHQVVADSLVSFLRRQTPQQ
ncbi:MAG: SGNH/GDSL hydrolase family protein [Bacteroidia bacterium]|nr:SGNH/GDSL hydrolase family protein [Bacteroidia bacterium]